MIPGAVRVIVKRGNKYLLVQRSKNSSNPGKWEYPGGKRDGQPLNKAIKRELKEETGLNLSKLQIIGDKCDNKKRRCTRFYRGKASGKIKLQKSEVQNYGWFTKKQANKLKLMKDTKIFLE